MRVLPLRAGGRGRRGSWPLDAGACGVWDPPQPRRNLSPLQGFFMRGPLLLLDWSVEKSFLLKRSREGISNSWVRAFSSQWEGALRGELGENTASSLTLILHTTHSSPHTHITHTHTLHGPCTRHHTHTTHTHITHHTHIRCMHLTYTHHTHMPHTPYTVHTCMPSTLQTYHTCHTHHAHIHTYHTYRQTACPYIHIPHTPHIHKTTHTNTRYTHNMV